jgi:ketosteroid isomerase-like protein
LKAAVDREMMVERMALHPQSMLMKALSRDRRRIEATLRPPRSRLERKLVRQSLHWSFDAFNRRDLDAAFALLPAKFVWEFLPEVPGFGVARSQAEVRQQFDDFLAEFPSYHTHIEEYLDDGERIALGVHAFNRGRHSGLEMNIRFVQTWDYEDGVHWIRERLTQPESSLTELMLNSSASSEEAPQRGPADP